MCQYTKRWGNIGVPEQHSDLIMPPYASRTFLTFLGLGCSVLLFPDAYSSNSLVSFSNLSRYRINDYLWAPLLGCHFLASWVGTIF